MSEDAYDTVDAEIVYGGSRRWKIVDGGVSMRKSSHAEE